MTNYNEILVELNKAVKSSGIASTELLKCNTVGYREIRELSRLVQEISFELDQIESYSKHIEMRLNMRS